jgi:pimeloyl-ACP methyl ester carboxylesterase
LVIWGENDIAIPVSMGRAYAAEIKGAQFVLVPNCGHTPQSERPDVFLKSVVVFLASHPIKQ